MTTIEPDDDAALELALNNVIRNPDNPQFRQVKEKLKREPRDKVAMFAAYSEQMDNLNLKPWQNPPMWIDDHDAVIALGKDATDYVAARTLRRMLRRGISRFHPNPLAALEAAKR